jgi:membrane-associated protein
MAVLRQTGFSGVPFQKPAPTMELLELITHTDDYLRSLIDSNLVMAYLIIFLIIYCESAFIAFPFLPGDGLLFSVGVVAASSPLNILLIIPLLVMAAILGNLTNYQLGLRFGQWVLTRNNRLVASYYRSADEFILKNGAKAVVLGRFFPIIRTYVPFVAGMVAMPYQAFFRHTVVGAMVWVVSFSLVGNLLGEVAWVKDNYGLIFLGLIVITLLPFLFRVFTRLIRRRSR